MIPAGALLRVGMHAPVIDYGLPASVDAAVICHFLSAQDGVRGQSCGDMLQGTVVVGQLTAGLPPPAPWTDPGTARREKQSQT
jgi:hypothetical protein